MKLLKVNASHFPDGPWDSCTNWDEELAILAFDSNQEQMFGEGREEHTGAGLVQSTEFWAPAEELRVSDHSLPDTRKLGNLWVTIEAFFF